MFAQTETRPPKTGDSPNMFKDRRHSPNKDESKSEMIGMRVDPMVGRRIDEYITVQRVSGGDMRTRSDFCRWAVEAALDFISENQDEGLGNEWLASQAALGHMERDVTDAIGTEDRVTKMVQGLISATQKYTSVGDYGTAAMIVNQFAASAVRVSQPILGRILWVRLSKSEELRQIIENIEQHGESTYLFDVQEGTDNES